MSRSKTPSKPTTKLSWQTMESMVKQNHHLVRSQQELIESLLARINRTEQQLNKANQKIRSLQHGLAISHLRGETTVFHMHSFLAHKAAVTCIGWLGDLLMTASSDKSFKVWEQSTDGAWTEINHIRGHTAGLSLIQRAGDLIMTASGDLTVKLWDPRLSWRCVGTLESHDKSVVSSACYVRVPTKLLVTGDRQGIMCVHDEKGGFTLVLTRNTKAGGILSMELLHPKSKFLVTAHNSGCIKVWDCIDFLEVRKIQVNKKELPIHRIKMWRHLLVSAGGDKQVQFWDTSTWTCVASGIGHSKSIYDICTTSVSTCLSGVPQEELQALKNAEGSTTETDAEVASMLATVGADGQILFWDPLSMVKHQQQKRNTEAMMHVKSVKTPRKKDKPQIITSGVFSPDGAVLVLADRAAHVHVFGGFASIYLNDTKEEKEKNVGGNVAVLGEEEEKDNKEATVVVEESEDRKEAKEETSGFDSGKGRRK